MSELQLNPGDIVSERYQLERLLGEGGMGAVWAATHVITKKSVALKFLKAEGNEQLVKRFLREARAVSAVNHPNVVAVHDILQLPNGTPLMVMDRLNGGDLAERLAKTPVLSVKELAPIIVPVLSALGTAHAARIVHRDLKPDNIYLHERPDGKTVPLVLDFGIAKLTAVEGEAAATAHLTQTGAVMGTPYYMSPEQVFGEKDVDQRSDVWSMGVILYECLSGRKPFDGSNFGQLFKAITVDDVVPLEQVAPRVPRDVTELVNQMLRRDRRERCQDLTRAFQTLRRYTSAKARSFESFPPDEARMAPEAWRDAEPGQAPVIQEEAPSPPDKNAPVTSITNETVETFSRTQGDAIPGLQRRWPLVAAALAGVAILGAGGLFFALGGEQRSTAATEPLPSAEASAAAASSLTAAGGPTVVPVTAPPPSAGAPDADARKAAPTAKAKKPAAKAVAAPAASSPPAEPSKPPDPPKEPARLPGSVVGDVPF